MKNYRLIKEYPGSPKLDTICKPNGFGVIAPKFFEGEFDKYKEFWEEVVIEKDYEILSFIDDKNNICKLSWKEDQCKQKYVIDNLHIFKIYSVKRLSDSQIFTIGDIVNRDNIISKDYPIAEFKIDNSENTILVSCYSIKNLSGIYNIRLKHLTKVKDRQKLFTTEDCVDVFEGDEYYAVNPLYVCCGKHIARLAITPDRTNHWETNSHYLKFFSTEKLARDYIINNIPIISLNDFHKVCNDYAKPRGIDKILRDFVISKLNQPW